MEEGGERYGNGLLMLPFAMSRISSDPTAELVAVLPQHAKRDGLDCTCPVCEQPVRAVLCEVKRNHFRHKDTNKQRCTIQNLHDSKPAAVAAVFCKAAPLLDFYQKCIGFDGEACNVEHRLGSPLEVRQYTAEAREKVSMKFRLHDTMIDYTITGTADEQDVMRIDAAAVKSMVCHKYAANELAKEYLRFMCTGCYRKKKEMQKQCATCKVLYLHKRPDQVYLCFRCKYMADQSELGEVEEDGPPEIVQVQPQVQFGAITADWKEAARQKRLAAAKAQQAEYKTKFSENPFEQFTYKEVAVPAGGAVGATVKRKVSKRRTESAKQARLTTEYIAAAVAQFPQKAVQSLRQCSKCRRISMDYVQGHTFICTPCSEPEKAAWFDDEAFKVRKIVFSKHLASAQS